MLRKPSTPAPESEEYPYPCQGLQYWPWALESACTALVRAQVNRTRAEQESQPSHKFWKQDSSQMGPGETLIIKPGSRLVLSQDV